MTAPEFATFWAFRHPEVPPLGYFFRRAYPSRWLRIHSLPDSQRYPASALEWQELLNRQNTIITDLFGENAPILVITGAYQILDGIDLAEVPDHALARLPFVAAPSINLHEVLPAEYAPGDLYKVEFSPQYWRGHSFDDLLTHIADGSALAFFTSLSHDCIAAPYDGGIDLILPDTATRERYRRKYQAWLSPHPEGL